jgi:hypothetical protein
MFVPGLKVIRPRSPALRRGRVVISTSWPKAVSIFINRPVE